MVKADKNIITVFTFTHSAHVHLNLRIMYPPRSIPTAIPGTTTPPMYKLASLDVIRYCDSINFGKNVPPDRAKASAVAAIVVKRKTLFLKMDFKAGRNSETFLGLCPSGTVSSANFFSARKSWNFGSSRGKPSRGVEASSKSIPPKRNPSHQAPTQALSSGSRSTPSG